MISLLSRTMLILSLALTLSVPQVMASNSNNIVVEEKPSELAMAADLVLVRPTLFVASILGSGLWLVSLPFSLAGGNAMQAGETLVAKPIKGTFVRCLGCKHSGYKKSVKSVKEDKVEDKAADDNE